MNAPSQARDWRAWWHVQEEGSPRSLCQESKSAGPIQPLPAGGLGGAARLHLKAGTPGKKGPQRRGLKDRQGRVYGEYLGSAWECAGL